jgi:hypothetical protein
MLTASIIRVPEDSHIYTRRSENLKSHQVDKENLFQTFVYVCVIATK